MCVELLPRKLLAAVLTEVLQSSEKLTQLLDHTGALVFSKQTIIGRAERKVNRPATPLCRTNSEERRLRDNGASASMPISRPASVPLTPPNSSSTTLSTIKSPFKLDSHVRQSLRDEQVRRNTGFHVVRPTPVQTVADDLSSERIVLPGFRTNRNGIDMPGKNQTSPTTRSGDCAGNIRTITYNCGPAKKASDPESRAPDPVRTPELLLRTISDVQPQTSGIRPLIRMEACFPTVGAQVRATSSASRSRRDFTYDVKSCSEADLTATPASVGV